MATCFLSCKHTWWHHAAHSRSRYSTSLSRQSRSSVVQPLCLCTLRLMQARNTNGALILSGQMQVRLQQRDVTSEHAAASSLIEHKVPAPLASRISVNTTASMLLTATQAQARFTTQQAKATFCSLPGPMRTPPYCVIYQHNPLPQPHSPTTCAAPCYL
jgi:hypothetical protein